MVEFFAEIRELKDLNAAVRARAEQLNVSRATIDHVAGLQDGYASKLMAPQPLKHLGPVSFGCTFRTLGLRVIVIDDPEAFEAIKDRLVPKASMKDHAAKEGSGEVNLAPRMMRFIMAENGRRGMKRLHASRTPAQRCASARTAAQARWRKF